MNEDDFYYRKMSKQTGELVLKETALLMENFTKNAEKLPELWLKAELYETLTEFYKFVENDIKGEGFDHKEAFRMAIRIDAGFRLALLDDLSKYYTSLI